MSDQSSPVVLVFSPRFDGEFFDGVPRRDLTQEDVDKLTPGKLHAITSPGGWDRPVYEKVKPAKAEPAAVTTSKAADTPKDEKQP